MPLSPGCCHWQQVSQGQIYQALWDLWPLHFPSAFLPCLPHLWLTSTRIFTFPSMSAPLSSSHTFLLSHSLLLLVSHVVLELHFSANHPVLTGAPPAQHGNTKSHWDQGTPIGFAACCLMWLFRCSWTAGWYRPPVQQHLILV